MQYACNVSSEGYFRVRDESPVFEDGVNLHGTTCARTLFLHPMMHLPVGCLSVARFLVYVCSRMVVLSVRNAVKAVRRPFLMSLLKGRLLSKCLFVRVQMVFGVALTGCDRIALAVCRALVVAGNRTCSSPFFPDAPL